jgi:PAS domain-containing protein
LGPIDRWPQSLRTITGFLIRSAVPLVLLWGADGVMIYNDAYSVFAGRRHPKLLGAKVREGNDAYVKISGRRALIGRSVREAFPELAGQGYYELLDRVYSTGQPVVTRGMELRLRGSDEVQFIDFVYAPIRAASGEVTGIFVGGYEVTEAHRAAAALRVSEQRLRELNVDLER